MKIRLWHLLALCAVICVALGCTTTEWGKIGQDAVEQTPATIDQIIANPTPVGALVAVGGLILFLFRKSAARGFGAGTSWVGSLFTAAGQTEATLAATKIADAIQLDKDCDARP